MTMMPINYELVKPLVEERQRQLRMEARVEVSRPGRLRTLAGLLLVRLGEQVAGVQRPRPAPVRPARLAVR
jgi:hypothetical protein